MPALFTAYSTRPFIRSKQVHGKANNDALQSFKTDPSVFERYSEVWAGIQEGWSSGRAYTGYSKSDLGGDLDGRRSTGGMAFYSNYSLVSWCSNKQKTVALSSCEGEFMSAAAACQALCLRRLLSEITGEEKAVVKLFVDNNQQLH